MSVVHAAQDQDIQGPPGKRVRRAWCGEMVSVHRATENPNNRRVTCPRCRERLTKDGVYLP